MRVVHVSKVAGIAGSERHLLSLLPALRAAGIDARMIVLEDDNFATIVDAIEEGRAIFANIRKAKPELGNEIETAPNRKPYYTDEELEGPRLDRAALAEIFAQAAPEPHRRHHHQGVVAGLQGGPGLGDGGGQGGHGSPLGRGTFVG